MTKQWKAMSCYHISIPCIVNYKTWIPKELDAITHNLEIWLTINIFVWMPYPQYLHLYHTFPYEETIKVQCPFLKLKLCCCPFGWPKHPLLNLVFSKFSWTHTYFKDIFSYRDRMTALVIAKMPNFNPRIDGWTDLPIYRQLFKGCNLQWDY